MPHELSQSMRTQNIYLFFSNVCKYCNCKQTLYSLITWLKHGWSVLASIALSINLRVVTFLQAHPSAFYQNRGQAALTQCIITEYD